MFVNILQLIPSDATPNEQLDIIRINTLVLQYNGSTTGYYLIKSSTLNRMWKNKYWQGQRKLINS